MHLLARSGSRIEEWYDAFHDALVRHDAVYACADGEVLFEIGLPCDDFQSHMVDVVTPVCHQVEEGCFSLFFETRAERIGASYATRGG